MSHIFAYQYGNVALDSLETRHCAEARNITPDNRIQFNFEHDGRRSKLPLLAPAWVKFADEPDRQTKKATTQKTYEETVQPYLERQKEYREHFSHGLKDRQADNAEQQVDDFFENEVRDGADRLAHEA